jgi:hypothetical protein
VEGRTVVRPGDPDRVTSQGKLPNLSDRVLDP